MTELYYKGLVSFLPAATCSVDNLNQGSRKSLEHGNEECAEKGWREQDSFIRLTAKGERTITGEMVLQQILREEMSKKINNVSELIEEVKEKHSNLFKIVDDIEKQLSNTQNKYIEMLGIFIAVFTIIISNIGIFTNIETGNFEQVVYMTLIINGTILFAIGFIILLLKGLVLNQKVKFTHVLFFIFPLLLFALGFLIIIFPDYLLPKDSAMIMVQTLHNLLY